MRIDSIPTLGPISIHAPRAGCDLGPGSPVPVVIVISIHAPRAECDRPRPYGPPLPPDFNPRTPCGVRPVTLVDVVGQVNDFNPRTPCGVRRIVQVQAGQIQLFQSTHPVRGATSRPSAGTCFWVQFQSTHPVRGATSAHSFQFCFSVISIHAPRAGCDSTTGCNLSHSAISIHAPRAGCDQR